MFTMIIHINSSGSLEGMDSLFFLTAAPPAPGTVSV